MQEFCFFVFLDKMQEFLLLIDFKLFPIELNMQEVLLLVLLLLSRTGTKKQKLTFCLEG